MTHDDLDTSLTPGDMVYDLAQEHAPMVATDTDVPRVGNLKPALNELVTTNYGNRVFGVTPDTPCVEVVYGSLDSEPSRTYIFPVTRVARPAVEAVDGVPGTGAELAQAHFLRQLLVAVDLAGAGGLRDTVLDVARDGTDLGADAVAYADEQADVDVSDRDGPGGHPTGERGA